MLYSFFLSKRGYTFVEVLIVVTVLGILVAVGVPIFTTGAKAEKIRDCNNQRTVIQGTVQEAMTGMMDNGKSQDKIRFDRIQDDHEGTLPASLQAIANNKKTAGDISCTNCLVLIEDQQIAGKIAFTLGDLRGGYRDVNTYPEYRDGCDWGYFLKKKILAGNKFYLYLANEEIPVCPFADFTDNKENNDYYYYIFEDGSVYCSCPECNK